MSAREEVLRRIRTAVAAAERPGDHARRYRTADDAPASIELFIERVQDYRAAVHRVRPDDVAALLGKVAAGRVVVPPGFAAEWLGNVDVVPDVPALAATELDTIDAVLTTCALAVAETGTIVLDGGPGQGRRAVSLVPDHHVVIVRESQVVETVPQAISRLDAGRPQTWISGPSATSDIELQRVEGVHGPRRLEVVLVGEPERGRQ